MKQGCIDAAAVEEDVRQALGLFGLTLRVSVMTAGETRSLHWMIEDTETGRRLVNYWPAPGKRTRKAGVSMATAVADRQAVEVRLESTLTQARVRLVIELPVPFAARADAQAELDAQLAAAREAFLAGDPDAVRLRRLRADLSAATSAASRARAAAAAAEKSARATADDGERKRHWGAKEAHERDAAMHQSRVAELTGQLPALERSVGRALADRLAALAQRLLAEARGELAAENGELGRLAAERLPRLLALGHVAGLDPHGLARSHGALTE